MADRRPEKEDMDTFADWTLSRIPSYGSPLLAIISFVGSLGIPFPISMVIVGAGALARMGLIDVRAGLVACLIGAAVADNCEYLLGRLAQPWLRSRFGQKRPWQKAQAIINQQGGWAILLTRFWFTPLAPPVNMIAGSRYPYIQFLTFDLLGQLIWVLLYGGLGWLFASQWRLVSEALGTFTVLSVVVVLAAAGIYILWQRHKTQGAS